MRILQWHSAFVRQQQKETSKRWVEVETIKIVSKIRLWLITRFIIILNDQCDYEKLIIHIFFWAAPRLT